MALWLLQVQDVNVAQELISGSKGAILDPSEDKHGAESGSALTSTTRPHGRLYKDIYKVIRHVRIGWKIISPDVRKKVID